MLIYKVLNYRRDRIELVDEVDDTKHDLIEEIEVPYGYETDEYIELLQNEVDLGDFCESSTRY